MSKALPPAARGRPLEVWFQDEARVGQQGTLIRVWAPRGSRPPAPRDTRYQWAYVFGAVCPKRAATAALVMPRADTHAMSAHLAEIAKEVAPGAHGIVILDGAGWHGARALVVPDNLTLVPLPPPDHVRGRLYAPELNPIENPGSRPGQAVWAYLRANRLAISVLDTYEDILERCCDAWNFFANDPERVRSVTARAYAETVSV